MYYCRECDRKFARIDTLPQMHTRTADIAEALDLYYAGLSLNDIRRNFIDQDNNYFSTATIYNWIKRFTDAAIKKTTEQQPRVGDSWLFKEITIGIDQGKVKVQDAYLKSRSARKVTLWLILDARSRYLLSFQLKNSISSPDFQELLEIASRRAGKEPALIITDKAVNFLQKSEKADTTMLESRVILQFDPGLISTFNDILDERTRFACALKNQSTLEKFMQGWLVHYNFFKSQFRLGNKTPAQTASINSSYGDWKGLIEGLYVVTVKNEPVTRRRIQSSVSVHE